MGRHVVIVWECPNKGEIKKKYKNVIPKGANTMQAETTAFNFVAGKQMEKPECTMAEYRIE